MKLKVASTFNEMMEGWRLVYKQYLKSALIDANPFSIFTYPEYIGRNSAVILGKSGEHSVCSVSAVRDSKYGLPLDAYFHNELNALRIQNKKLIEIGLLANVSERAGPFYIIELLSSIARFGVYSNYHDYVIGVHPRRAAFYKNLFGLQQIGESRKYHQLHEAEVILLHASGQDFEPLTLKATKAIYFNETDLNFKNRFRFIRMASLKPFVLINQLFTILKKLWRQVFPAKIKSTPELTTLKQNN